QQASETREEGRNLSHTTYDRISEANKNCRRELHVLFFASNRNKLTGCRFVSSKVNIRVPFVYHPISGYRDSDRAEGRTGAFEENQYNTRVIL
ncbi:AAEL010554-PA, partial [Aedes aegypti]